jgi:cell division septation protein DedD
MVNALAMRDEHRFREKIELSLEKRHVAWIGIAALSFLAAAFSLGLFVGQGLVSRAASPAPVDDLAALDAQDAVSSASVAGTDHPEAAPARNDTPRAPEPPRRSEPPAGSTAAKPPVRSIPQPPEPTPIPPGPRTAEVVPPQTAVLPPPPANPGKYTVQIGATQDRAEAHEMVNRIAKAGLRPYVVQAKLPGRGLWYRVRVGAFADRAAADQYRKDIERELRTPAMVMPSSG